MMVAGVFFVRSQSSGGVSCRPGGKEYVFPACRFPALVVSVRAASDAIAVSATIVSATATIVVIVATIVSATATVVVCLMAVSGKRFVRFISGRHIK